MGIDPELMDRFIGEMERARGTIGERSEAMRRILAANGVSAASLAPIREIAGWLDQELAGLRRRREQVRDMVNLPGWTPQGAGRLLPYREKNPTPTLTPEQARRKGRELAEKYRLADTGLLPGVLDPKKGEKYQEVVEELAAHADDAEFTAAFFAALGVKKTLELPERLRKGLPGGQEDRAGAVAMLSRAFGTAISGTAGGKGLAEISKKLQSGVATNEEKTAIAHLLSEGRFPTEWLAGVVSAQALAPGSKVAGPMLTPYLAALAKDPGATRLAFGLASRDLPLPKTVVDKIAAVPGFSMPPVDGRPDMAALLKDLNARSAGDKEAADAFGQVLAAGSGALNEVDGKHTEPAARFAFNVITTVGDLDVGEATRIHLSKIAGAYATELAEGANLGRNTQLLPSALGQATSNVPGLQPMFRLSPQDTYRFITRFANTQENLLPFQVGMGNLAHRLINDNVPGMLASKDPTRLDEVFGVLGNVRGLELAAQKKWLGQVDEATESAGKAASLGVGTALGAVGLAVPGGMVGAALWTGLSTGWSVYDTYKDDPEKKVEELGKEEAKATLGRRYAVARSLMEAGFNPKFSPNDFQASSSHGVPITDDAGNLRPFEDIYKSGDNGIRALDGWLIANGLGTDKESFGSLTEELASGFEGKKKSAETRSQLYGSQS
jgi:hypothetical protein